MLKCKLYDSNHTYYEQYPLPEPPHMEMEQWVEQLTDYVDPSVLAENGIRASYSIDSENEPTTPIVLIQIKPPTEYDSEKGLTPEDSVFFGILDAALAAPERFGSTILKE